MVDEDKEIQLADNAVVWKSEGAVSDCCFQHMDDCVAAGRSVSCWCGTRIRATDGMIEKSFTGGIEDFEPDAAVKQKHLKLLYFRKKHFLGIDAIRKWQERHKGRQVCSMVTIGHEAPDIFDVSKTVETPDAWLVKLDDNYEANTPVFSRIDTGIVGIFDE